MCLVISTIPHFLSVKPLIKARLFGYASIIVTSSTLSVLYHLYEESNDIITVADYLFATIWFLFDMYYTYNTGALYKVILGNSVVAILNMQIPYDRFYVLNHSIWYLMNACKCYYVSTLISKLRPYRALRTPLIPLPERPHQK